MFSAPSSLLYIEMATTTAVVVMFVAVFATFKFPHARIYAASGAVLCAAVTVWAAPQAWDGNVRFATFENELRWVAETPHVPVFRDREDDSFTLVRLRSFDLSEHQYFVDTINDDGHVWYRFEPEGKIDRWWTWTPVDVNSCFEARETDVTVLGRPAEATTFRRCE